MQKQPWKFAHEISCYGWYFKSTTFVREKSTLQDVSHLFFHLEITGRGYWLPFGEEKEVSEVSVRVLRVDGRRGRKKIGPLDDAFQLFAWKGRWESSGAIEISGLKRCYFCLYDLWKKLLCCWGEGASRKERSDGWSKMLELMSAQRWVIASDIEDDVRRMWVNIYKEQQ